MPSAPIELQPADQEGWMRATGEVLPQELLVRFSYADGRLRVTGLCLDNGEPITAAVLRNIPVGQLASAYLPQLREQFQDVRRQILEDAPGEHAAGRQERFTELLEPMLRIATSGEEAVLGPRGRGAKTPTAAEYRAFARMYADELSNGPEWGALTRTAKRWGVHRSTALRWLENMPAELEGEE